MVTDGVWRRRARSKFERGQGGALRRILRASPSEARVILGLARDSYPSGAEITKAFRQQSLLVHPDKNPIEGASAAFKALTQAYKQVISGK